MYSDNTNSLINNEFSNINYGRVLLLNKFEELVKNINLHKKLRVAVIGGTHEEPEVILLKKKTKSFELKRK